MSSEGCYGCHGSETPSPNTHLTLQSTSTTVEAGKRVELSIVIAHDSAKVAGIDIAVATSPEGAQHAGLLDAPEGSGLRLFSEQLLHATPHPMDDNVMFTFGWTAPIEPGTYYLQAVGLAANGDGTDGWADEWNWLTPVALTVTPAVSVQENDEPHSLEMNTVMQSGEPYMLTMFSIDGAEVLRLNDQRGYPTHETTGLSPGLYLVEIQTRRYRGTSALFLR